MEPFFWEITGPQSQPASRSQRYHKRQESDPISFPNTILPLHEGTCNNSRIISPSGIHFPISLSSNMQKHFSSTCWL